MVWSSLAGVALSCLICNSYRAAVMHMTWAPVSLLKLLSLAATQVANEYFSPKFCSFTKNIISSWRKHITESLQLPVQHGPTSSTKLDLQKPECQKCLWYYADVWWLGVASQMPKICYSDRGWQYALIKPTSYYIPYSGKFSLVQIFE